jgi:hypothetical protein
MKSTGKVKNANLALMGALLLIHFGFLGAQSTTTIKGTVINKDKLPVVYSTVALINSSDSALVTGTSTDSTGRFELTTDLLGTCFLRISFVGYEISTTPINIQSQSSLETGEIILHEKTFEINEAKVFGERIKARQELDKTSYFANKQMQEASSTAVDMIKFIPGVQVDLFQNVMLEGNSNILILINGVERESGFLQQLSAERIDKVEVNNQPGPKYPGEIAGVINIILKPENNQGISGHVSASLPTNFNEVYTFPSYSFNLTRNKMNLFTSYNGELSYFNIEANNTRDIFSGPFESQINKVQYLHQKNWSHKFHYGFEYQPNNKNVLSIYGFLNPTSYEFDGTVQISKIARDSVDENWEAEKEDADLNFSWFNSLYFQHKFDKEGSELVVELNQYKFNGHHQSTLTPSNTEAPLVSISNPRQRLYTGKVDVVIPVNSTIKIESGVRESFSLFSDSEWSSFRYTESICAAYASIRYNGERFRFSSGLRMEHARLKLEESYDNQSVTLLPNLSAQFDLPKQQGLKFTYRKSVIRPRMYQLNPNISYTDPFTIHYGNPNLTPAINNELALDYTRNLKKNFISVGGFYQHTDHSIENLTVLNETGMFENSTENLGAISRIGINLKGSIKPLKNILVNPSVKLYNFSSRGNTTATENNIRNKRQFGIETGLTIAATFKYDITVASVLNYYSAKTSIQGYRFEDLLYFISVDKSFKNKYKVGLNFALPFMGEFTYQGYQTDGFQFHEYSEDNLQLSLIPVWLKFTYNFASGKKTNRIIKNRDFEDPNLKNGF